MGRFEEAITDLSRAIGLDSGNAWAIGSHEITKSAGPRHRSRPPIVWAISIRGHAYRKMGRFEEAIADLDGAIELNPIAASIIISDLKRYENQKPAGS